MKFISIIDFYSRNVAGMIDMQNYHLLPIKIAEASGFETELWVLNPNHEASAIDKIPKDIKVRLMNNKLKYIYNLLKEKDAIIYSNARILRTMIASFFGAKTIFMNHTSEHPKKYKFIIKHLMSNFDLIRAVNRAEKDNLIKMGIKEHKIEIISHAIDLDFWRQGSKEKDLDVVTVANVRELKNIDIIKKACDKLNLKLTVVGENMSNQDINVTGKKTPEEIREYLHRAKVYVNSSESEGFCLSVYEAIATGLPLCLSNLSTFKHLKALFHEPRGVDTLAENIKKQINDPIYPDPTTNNYSIVFEKFKEMIE